MKTITKKYLEEEIEEMAITNYTKRKRCRYCKTTENLTIDHKVPKRQGGKNEVSNLQTLCQDCNRIKSGLSHKEVVRYFKWFLEVQSKRVEAGKNPYSLK